jgi:ferredoxin--NADP+ reductase
MLNGTIVKRELVTPDLMILGVAPDAGVPDFQPGQYVVLALPADAPRAPSVQPEREPQSGDKLIKRAYSIGSSPTQKEGLEFFIAIVPDGSLTPRLLVPAVGERVHVGPKITGTFTIHDSKPDEDLVFVATGTGLAPFISMLRFPGTLSHSRNVTLVHGVRYPSDFAYQQELTGYAKSFAGRFNYLPIASRADATFPGLKGRVQKLFIDDVVKLDPTSSRIYLCGNPAMIEEMEGYLGGRGFSVHHAKKNPAGRLHVEKYW